MLVKDSREVDDKGSLVKNLAEDDTVDSGVNSTEDDREERGSNAGEDEGKELEEAIPVEELPLEEATAVEELEEVGTGSGQILKRVEFRSPTVRLTVTGVRGGVGYWKTNEKRF